MLLKVAPISADRAMSVDRCLINKIRPKLIGKD